MPERITEVTAFLAEMLAPRAPLTVIVDGGEHGAAAGFASRLAAAFPASARAWTADAVLGLTGPPAAGNGAGEGAAGQGAGADMGIGAAVDAGVTGSTDRVIVYLRSGPRGRTGPGAGERRAHVVIDHHDPMWPVIRHVHPALSDPDRWYLAESRAFFAIRAAGWDAKFGDDLPAYAQAVHLAGLRPGGLALDVGCGTGRALPALAAAVGARGRVIGLDLTPDMLTAARTAGRGGCGPLILADARRLPIGPAVADAVFAAGLVPHLPDPVLGLAELARVTRPGGRLVLFHPSGRAALASRHGRTLRADEPLNEANLAPLLTVTGWRLTRYDDLPERFLALADRADAPE